MQETTTNEPSFIPPPRPPRGAKYYLGTWSGRLILINTIVFIAMTYYSGSILMPDQETLLLFGAKDPVRLTQGEYWRFVTPIFVHIGLLHFTFNTVALYYIGYQLEVTLGRFWYLLIYMVAGAVGNVASGVFSLAISAGASGALFGLLGAGYLIEKTIDRRVEEMTGRRPRRGAYAGMVTINILFGLFIPGIDNAAHIGGLLTGIALTFVMMNIRPNRLRPLNRRLGIAVAVLASGLVAVGVYLATSKTFMLDRFVEAASDSKNRGQSVYYLTQAAEIDPTNRMVRFKRGWILLLGGEREEGFNDLMFAATDLTLHFGIQQLVTELQSMGRTRDAELLQLLLKESEKKNSP